MPSILMEIAKLRALARPYLQRCHRLDLDERNASPSNSFLPLQGEFPQLKHLKYTSLQSRESLFGATFHAPDLHSVVVNVASLERIMDECTPISASLTTSLDFAALDLKSASLFRFPIASQDSYSSIRILRLDGQYSGYWGIGTPLHLQFPSLEVFSFFVRTYDTDSIRTITAPNLLYLQIRSAALYFVLPPYFLVSRFPKLAALQLSGNRSPRGETEAFILAHPSLELFAFVTSSAISLVNICSYLKSTANGEARSRLRSISFYCYSPDGFFLVPRALATLLEKLESLQIFWTQYAPPPTLIGWQEWHRAVGPVGLRLHLTFGTGPVDLVGHFFAFG